MKILTKPEQFRIASPSIYGYEGDWSWVSSYEDDSWVYDEYECFDSTEDICEPGDTYTDQTPKRNG
ncbi:MAG: hypothetical protein J4F29_23145 [Candidatus Latescibacteria bacterium]|nr:hypothetical protein [Candidatus Latescibacterota bacterium]